MKPKNAHISKESAKSGQAPPNSHRLFKISAILLGAVVLFAIGWFSMDARISATQSKGAAASSPQDARQAQPPDYGALIGQWQRPDGGYMLEISGVSADGRLDAAYFNPNPIHVARAETVARGYAIQIFVELQDKGYPGASYQLLYQPGQKILTGRYNQPAAGGSYDVYFVKKGP